MAISVVANLSVLALFKHGQFAVNNLAAALEFAGVHFAPPKINLGLPIGISFYTFRSMSYVIDVYRRELEAR